MRKLLVSSLSLVALLGCTNPVVVSSEVGAEQIQQVSNLGNVHWNKVTMPSHFTFSLTKYSQTFNKYAVDSPIGAFTFPVSNQNVSIEITSYIKKQSVYAPSLSLYDQNFNLIKTYGSDVFKYDRDNFIKGDVINGEAIINLPLSVTQVYAIIHTTKNDLDKTTTMIHPAKAFAIAKRNVQPNLDDPVAEHSLFGTVKVEVSIPSKLFSFSESSSPSLPDEVNKAALVSQPETTQFYHSAIEQAVAKNDIPKALSLLEEAKALGVMDAQKVFVQAVNNK